MDCTDLCLIDEIRTLLIKAAEKIMHVYNSGDYGTIYKNDSSPVTLADTLSNDIITSGLQNITPGIPVISEESALRPYNIRKTFREVWILDPLDGTKEFVRHNDEFCICLALIRDGRPRAGFIMAPVSGEFWYALLNKGAWKIVNGSTVRMPLHKSPHTPVILISRSHHNDAEKQWIRDFSEKTGAEIRIQGSAIKFCLLAEGNATVYPKLGPINEWDVAAGDIILFEAGGCIQEQNSKQKPAYNKETLRQPHFFAYGPGAMP